MAAGGRQNIKKGCARGQSPRAHVAMHLADQANAAHHSRPGQQAGHPGWPTAGGTQAGQTARPAAAASQRPSPAADDHVAYSPHHQAVALLIDGGKVPGVHPAVLRGATDQGGANPPALALAAKAQPRPNTTDCQVST